MACILKKPDKTKGVVTFTTRELDRDTPLRFLLGDKKIVKKIKENWLIGLHANWQTDSFNGVFDFGLGRKGGLSGCPSNKLIEMDASCFCTPEFYPSKYENKFWDIIGMGKMGGARDLNPFLSVIRKIYDTKFFPRVLLIAGIPDKPCNLLSNYRKKFNHFERQRFNLVEIKYNYPFPWDYKTISFYLRSSKIYLNSDSNGLPCRTFTCAIGSGLPFISRPWKFPIVPNDFLKEPAHYFGNNLDELAMQSVKALNNYSEDTLNNQYIKESVDWLNFENATTRLKQGLAPLLGTTLESLNSEEMNLNNLHIRIARHSSRNIGHADNGTDIDINQIIHILQTPSDYSKINMSSDDVELSLFKSLNLKRKMDLYGKPL